MSNLNIYKLLIRHTKTAILAGLFLGAISFLFLVTTQKNFRSSTDVLIVQNQEGPSDYYAMSRSADYLSNVLMESVGSEKFLSEVIASGKVSSDFIFGDKAERIRQWQKIIIVKKNSNVGIVNVKIFGNTQKQTAEISEGVLDVLINKSSMFLGRGQNLEVRVLSGPIIDKNPSLGQIIFTSAGGFLVGLILVFMWIIYREQMRILKGEDIEYFDNKIRLYPIEEFKKKENNEIKEIHKVDEEILKSENYISADSEFWRKRLNNEL
jgi:capsular polysaccharide biosynthesis protein